MTTIELPLTTVGSIAASSPASARVLEAFGIDYCCSGGRSLEEACRARKIDPATVREALKSAPREDSDRDWAGAPLAELAAHIERTHHGYLRRELPRLVQLVQKVEAAHRDRDQRLEEVRGVFLAFAEELLEHMHKEERVLFPAIAALEGSGKWEGSLTAPIDCLTHEHEEAGRALSRLRELTDAFTPSPNACTTWRVMLASLEQLEADMHQHVHLENNILFPSALRLARRG